MAAEAGRLPAVCLVTLAVVQRDGVSGNSNTDECESFCGRRRKCGSRSCPEVTLEEMWWGSPAISSNAECGRFYYRANPGCDQARGEECREAGSAEQLLRRVRHAYDGNVVAGHDLEIFWCQFSLAIARNRFPPNSTSNARVVSETRLPCPKRNSNLPVPVLV
jgi:hypothetical protein